jgi:hypothetical protein
MTQLRAAQLKVVCGKLLHYRLIGIRPSLLSPPHSLPNGCPSVNKSTCVRDASVSCGDFVFRIVSCQCERSDVRKQRMAP